MDSLTTTPLAEGLIFGEGPRWHDGKLWVSDMYAKRVVTVDLDGNVAQVVDVPGRPSGLGWLPDGRLLIVSMDDYRLAVMDEGQLATYADLRPHCGGVPNDMVVDERGRAYVGNFGFDMDAGETMQAANLLLVDNGEVRVVAKNLIFPNGMVISPDGGTLIVAESFASKLTGFDIHADGSLTDRRVFADLGERTPDGICLDAEGAVWAGCFMSGEFIRVRDGGEVTHEIDVGDRRGVACMLGGPERKTLFVLPAETTSERLVHGDSKCRVETVVVDVPGAGWP